MINNNWSRNDKIAFIALIISVISCIAAIIVVPEVRGIFGLDNNGTPNSPEKKPEQNGKNELFSSNNPYPNGLNKLKIETTLSDLQKSYPPPFGKLGDGCYYVKTDREPFISAKLSFNKYENDPKIYSVDFVIHNEPSAKEYIIKQAKQVFGPPELGQANLQKIWPNIGGYRVEIYDDGYNVSQAKPNEK